MSVTDLLDHDVDEGHGGLARNHTRTERVLRARQGSWGVVSAIAKPEHDKIRDLRHGRHSDYQPIHRLIDRGMDRIGAVLRAGELQMRPVLMTCVIAGVGLVPAALSTGIGSQVQKPLAVVVVGGMTLAPLLILIVLPALIALVARHKRVPASEVLVAARPVGS